MSLSYKVIKNDSVSYVQNNKFLKDEKEINDAYIQAKTYLEKAKYESKNIIEAANKKSKDIEKLAYEKGYSQGVKNGYEDGYKQVYEEYVKKAKEEHETIIKNSSETLININEEVMNHIKSSKDEILNLSIHIARKVIGKHFKEEKSMNEILDNIIKVHEIKEHIIVKVNEIYKESLEDEIKIISKKHNTKDITVILDNNLDDGEMVIQKKSGSITLNSNLAIEKIKSELIGEKDE